MILTSKVSQNFLILGQECNAVKSIKGSCFFSCQHNIIFTDAQLASEGDAYSAF